MGKKFKDTLVGGWLLKTAPDVLSTVGALLPSSGVFGLVKNIIALHPTLTPQQKADFDAQANSFALEIAQIEAQSQATEDEELTKRAQSDMTSDSWLSKNVRPLCLIYLLLASTTICILDSCKILTVQAVWVTLLTTLLTTAFAFYFGGRSWEKMTALKNQ